MSFERVIFYDKNDLLYGYGLEKITTMELSQYDNIDVNDAIEYYQIYKYFADGARNVNWSDSQYQTYIKKSKELISLTYRFFNSIDDEKIIAIFNQTERFYLSAFWELFNSTKLYDKISENSFKGILMCENMYIYSIIEKKSLVKKYGKTLREFLLNNDNCAKVLVYYYEQDDNDSTKIYLPDEFTGNDCVQILENYVKSDSADLNILESIYYMRKTERFPITDELRLEAKRRYLEEFNKLKKSGSQLRNEISVSISKNQEKEYIEEKKGINIKTSYSYAWLSETLDYPSILNNFIYVFKYADFSQMLCNLVSVSSKGSIIEKGLRVKNRKTYPTYFANNMINALAILQMESYYNFLSDKKIRYEDVLQWFFTEYLQKEFGCSEMRVKMPSENSTILEKCENICTAMEMAVKQFSQYAEKKKIDFELLSISSGSPKYNAIPSLNSKKYIYGCGKDFEEIKFFLFSDQCFLCFPERFLKKNKLYKSFFELISYETVYKNDYRETEQRFLEKLLSHGFIVIAEDGKLSFGNIVKLKVIKDLYYKEVLSRWHYPDSAQQTIQELIDCNILYEKSKLLTEPESNFFDYYLNHNNYLNGPDLRNRYSHGNGQIITDNEEHKKNYNILLILMTVLAIKINDDFCIYDERKKGEE